MEKIYPSEEKIKDLVKLLLVTFLAVNLSGLAIAMFLEANLGSDTITVFIDGVHRVLNIGYGNASRLYNLILLIIAFVLARRNIGWMTIVYALTIGFAIDIYEGLFILVNIDITTIFGKLLLITFAQILFGIAYALLISYRKGMNQIDAIAFFVCQRLTFRYVYVRIAMDVLLVVCGWLMGGVVGIGSIIAMASTSLFINGSLKVIKSLRQKYVIKTNVE